MHAYEGSSRDERVELVEVEFWEGLLLEERTTLDDYRQSMLRCGCAVVVAERAVEQMIHRLNETRIVRDHEYFAAVPCRALAVHGGPIEACECEIDPATRTCLFCGF